MAQLIPVLNYLLSKRKSKYMLNKEICIKCIKKWNKEKRIYHYWNTEDENRWNNNQIFCIIDSKVAGISNYRKHRYIINTNEPPPDFCPYRLEHIIS